MVYNFNVFAFKDLTSVSDVVGNWVAKVAV